MKIFICPICGKNLENNVSFKAGETVFCMCRWREDDNGLLLVENAILPLPTPQEV